MDVVVNRSTDGGRTWSGAVVVAAGGFLDKNWTACDNSRSSPFYGRCYTEFDNASLGDLILMSTSSDGGATWSSTVLVSNAPYHLPDGNVRAPIPLPSAETDRRGKVYVVWPDCRFRTGCSANDLVLSTSTDGLTWSAVKRVPIDPVAGGVDHFVPASASTGAAPAGPRASASPTTTIRTRPARRRPASSTSASSAPPTAGRRGPARPSSPGRCG